MPGEHDIVSTIKLSKAIVAHGEELTELTLREPTGKDIRTCGSHITGNGRGGSIDTEAIARYISALAEIPPSSVDLLSGADFLKAQSAVLGFFRVEEETSSTATST